MKSSEIHALASILVEGYKEVERAAMMNQGGKAGKNDILESNIATLQGHNAKERYTPIIIIAKKLV